jgi:cysteine desulfurase
VGVGALLLTRDLKLSPLFQGGSHERGLRSGTPDAAAVKAFAIAVAEAVAEREEKAALHEKLTAQLIAGVREVCKTVQVTGEGTTKLPNVVHFRFQDVLGETLMFLLDQEGVAVSTGAACTAGVAEPSHVILALGGSEADALACLRVSLGHSSTASDVDAFLKAFPAAYLAATKAHLVGKK